MSVFSTCCLELIEICKTAENENDFVSRSHYLIESLNELAKERFRGNVTDDPATWLIRIEHPFKTFDRCRGGVTKRKIEFEGNVQIVARLSLAYRSAVGTNLENLPTQVERWIRFDESTKPTETDTQPDKKPEKVKPEKPPTIAERQWAEYGKNQGSAAWSAATWAESLKCTKSGVYTSAWHSEEFRKARALRDATRDIAKRDRSRR